jgi:iron complex outermembrane recepter protein
VKKATQPSCAVFAAVSSALFVGASALAVADDTTPNGELTEIVVTATKRNSTVQETPISLTAISGADLLDRGVTDLAQIAQSVPGISMRTSGPGQTEFEMRGMASVGGDSPTVGFYLDDTPLTAPATTNNGKVVIDPNLYDLNRIEVLRGPQGTLYGSGSMGGTIKLVPNPPNPSAFDVSAETGLGDTDGGGFDHRENAMLNIPFGGGTAALRIVGSESHDSGWLSRVVIANGDFPLETNGGLTRGNVLAAPVAEDYRGVNDTELTGVRAALLWRPIDGLIITPTYLYQRITQGGLNDIDSDPGTNAHYQPFDIAEPFSDTFHLASLNVSYEFPDFSLTSNTSRWSRVEDLNQDASEQWQWALGLPSYYVGNGGVGPVNPNLEQDKSRQTSEEVRLTSTWSSPFQWLVGYYYADFGSDWNAFIIAPEGAPVLGTPNIYTQYVPTKITQQSQFAELSYKITSELKATIGARHFSYDAAVYTTVNGAVGPTGTDTATSYVTSERDQGVNPKFDLSYEPSKNLLVYTTAAKGFRPGGGTGPIPTSGPLGSQCEANLQTLYGTTSFVPSPVSYGPDQVWSYELGEKWRALGGRVTINSAAYFENWGGVQQNIPLGCSFQFTANAGDAHIYGGEIELQAALTDELIFSGNTGYAHAQIVKSNVLGVGIEPGTAVQEVPNWTSSASLAYRHTLTDQLAVTARIENNYVGSRTDSTFAINQLSPYDLTNVRFGVASNRWSATLYATNLLDKRALLNNVTQVSINLPTYNRVAVTQPLTVGIDLSYHFGGSQ